MDDDDPYDIRLTCMVSARFMPCGSNKEESEYTDNRLGSCINCGSMTAPAAKGSGSESVNREFWYDLRSRGWSEGVRGSEIVWGSDRSSYSYERTVDETDFAGGRLVKNGRGESAGDVAAVLGAE